MTLDPDTKVSSLLAAIPSSAQVFGKFGITTDADDLTLQQACARRGVKLDEFLRALDEIDWHNEAPRTHKASPS